MFVENLRNRFSDKCFLTFEKHIIFKIVNFYCQAGASPHLKDKNLKTPLMYAAEHNHSDVVKYLLKANAIIDAKVRTVLTLFVSFYVVTLQGH